MAPTRTDRNDTDEDAVDLLASDHDAIAELFDRYETLAADEASAEERHALAEEICTLLLVHGAIKEEIFYPAARECLPDDEDLMDDAQEEHDAAKELIHQIQLGAASDDDTCALFLELSDAIDDHVQEEQDEMFPKVREAGMNTAEVGGRLKARKDELEADAAKGIPVGSPTQSLMDRIAAFWGPPSI